MYIYIYIYIYIYVYIYIYIYIYYIFTIFNNFLQGHNLQNIYKCYLLKHRIKEKGENWIPTRSKEKQANHSTNTAFNKQIISQKSLSLLRVKHTQQPYRSMNTGNIDYDHSNKEKCKEQREKHRSRKKWPWLNLNKTENLQKRKNKNVLQH